LAHLPLATRNSEEPEKPGTAKNLKSRGHQLEAEVRRLLGLEAKQAESKEEG
jgi:hypothetical protein